MSKYDIDKIRKVETKVVTTKKGTTKVGYITPKGKIRTTDNIRKENNRGS